MIDGWSFLEGRITETVATTCSPDGDHNLAPMGVVRDDSGAYARLWEGSDTLANVRATNAVTLNFTRDPVVYAKGALGDADDFVEGGRLSDADAWIDCDAEFVGEEKDGSVERWRLEITDSEVRRRRVFTVNRGFNAVVEAAVHATRVEFRPELRELIEHHLETARKCGGEREREAADTVEDFLNDV